ncbi:MAG: ATP-binding protein [Candidatus Cloacimonetes bacterium]|nr:ATP-binding protein [Candidatus Cloacimonadota bacterium]
MRTKLFNTIKQLTQLANEKFHLWNSDEKVIIALSGGKDSSLLFEIMKDLSIDVIGVHVKLFPSEDSEKVCNFLVKNQITVLETNILEQAKSSQKNDCFICSRLRRKALLEYADKISVKKIAFAHHKDDVVETLLMNMIYSREISTMIPKQKLFKGEFEIIRPFYFVEERLLSLLAKELQPLIFENKCRMDYYSKRHYIKEIISEIKKQHPKTDILDNIFSSLKQIKTDFIPKL